MAIMMRSTADAGSFITTYPGDLILVFGIPFVLFIIICFLLFSGFFACVMGNGITHCLRRARNRREESRKRRQHHRDELWLTKEYGKRLRMENANEQEREKRRQRELREREKAQKNAREYSKPLVTAPEAAHIPPSSSIIFSGSHRPTHGPSARIAGSESLCNRSAQKVSGTRSQIDAWNLNVERGLAPDNVSLRTDASLQGRVRLQRRDRSISVTSRSRAPAYVQDDASTYSSASAQRPTRLQKLNHGHGAGGLSHESLSQDRHMGSIGGSSLLFDDRGSIDQRSTSEQGLLSERH